MIEQIETFNSETSICTILDTSFGELAVYGTIIGIYGNRHENFNVDLEKQLLDFKKISASQNICIAGDFNISFSDNYYFTKMGRQELNTIFENQQLNNVTKNIAENIDHIVISEKFIENCNVESKTWNLDKKLSDHIGVSVTISKN
jgi:endonuclease/exonuclease/phosphatase family metal-dependent hydrolase